MRVGYSHLGSPMPSRRMIAVAQVGVEPTASLVLSQGGLPIAYRAILVRVPCGSWTRLSGLEDRRLCQSAKGTKSGRRGSRTLKAHRSVVFGTTAIANWLALPFSLDGWIRTSDLRLPTPAD